MSARFFETLARLDAEAREVARSARKLEREEIVRALSEAAKSHPSGSTVASVYRAAIAIVTERD